jgi:hypothetical protein
LKKFPFFCVLLVLGFYARSSQLAMIVLDTAEMARGPVPSNWQLKVNHGKPEVAPCSDSDGACLRLKSVSASFALERNVDVDPADMPYLTWRWKVAQLPKGGDFRRSSTDDQAAQLLVAFTDRRVVSYIWDTTAPKGTSQSAGFIPLVHVFAIVCQSGVTGLNQWVTETHNMAADYRRAYGKPAPRVKGLRIQINSQHTGTTAESYFGEVAFRGSPQ